jgi:Fe2+ or Zn2+ uptake regulation protein
VLAYLVTSKARRRVLELLWRRHAVGTASDLAKLARVSFASAYRELKLMEAFGLAATTTEHGREVYAAATGHPQADLVSRLVSIPGAADVPSDDISELTRRRARSLGAPLQVAPEPVPEDDREQAVVEVVRLARRDATLARTLPVLLWQQRNALDRDRLRLHAQKARQKHALGFLLALTAELAGEPALDEWAESFRDRRARGTRPFFELSTSHTARALAERRTPEVARRWGYWMDLDLPSFQSLFDKFSPMDTTSPRPGPR